MLKKRMMCIILAILSFFVFTTSGCAFSVKGIFGGKGSALEEASGPMLKMYMPTSKAEPIGGVNATKIKATKGAEKSALRLYDGDTHNAASHDTAFEVTLDMGKTIILSHLRYYAGAIDEKNGNNCLGTRFYASVDNKKFVELAVIEGDVAPEDNWYEINFNGFGEYRYFKVAMPAKSNLCEVEWIETESFTRVRQSDGKYDIGFNLCAFDARESMDASVLVLAYNDKGKLKHIALTKQHFEPNMNTEFKVELLDTDVKVGDSYRIIVFGEDGVKALQSPLNYRVNGAARELSVSSAFSDNMVLQADKPVKVWGTAPRHREIEVSIENDLGGGVRRIVEADENSKWEVVLGTFSSGGRYTMTVKADERTAVYKNITFGDVWVCAGQSNMDYYMVAGEETAADLKNNEAVENSDIRLLNLWNKGIMGAAAPVDNPPTGGVGWQEMDADSAAYFSAVGYYFARDIYEAADVPIGMINVAVGDTEINRWIPLGDKYGSFTSTDGDLYNNRIKPFENLEIKGIILYQGEADQYRTHLTEGEYSDAMAGLVDNYRKSWGEDLPFYWAQLTRYKVDESIVREGQRMALSKVTNKSNIGMVVLNDIVGNYSGGTGSCRDDIHPWGKKIVAKRFAAYARRDCYEKDGAVTGPVYKSAKRSGNSFVLTFECEGDLTVMPKERYADKIADSKIKKEKIDVSKPMEFEVAGADGEFYPATAKLDGKTVVLSSDKVKTPMRARYAWGAYPEMPNLTDETGLPTATFDTANM